MTPLLILTVQGAGLIVPMTLKFPEPLVSACATTLAAKQTTPITKPDIFFMLNLSLEVIRCLYSYPGNCIAQHPAIRDK